MSQPGYNKLFLDSETDKQREQYYRSCLREFERLGYQDQFLDEVKQDLRQVDMLKLQLKRLNVSYEP